MQVARCCTSLGLVVFFLTDLSSQNKGIGTITGLIVDESTERPLQFVNVVLLNKADSSLVTGTVVDKTGRFDFSDVPGGNYMLRFSLIGYRERVSTSFIIDAEHRKLNFGTTALTEAAVNLDEVLVTSQRALFNNSIDRKVYNVEQDIMSKTGSASELLANVPSIQVDIDGNVSLRGSSNVLILINGKNSPLMGRNRATVLEQLPASSIEKIEVITNPSAKYRPDGTAGIINLVLKKNTSLGLNGNLTGTGGNNNRLNGTVRLNYNPGDWNVFGSYSLRRDSRNRNNTDTRTQTDAASTVSYYRDDLASFASPLSNMVALGMDYNFDKANSAGLSGNYFHNGFTRTDNSRKNIQDVNRVPFSIYERNRHDDEYQEESGLTFFFQHNFGSEDHKVRLDFTSSKAPEQEDNHYTNTYSLPATPATYDNTLIRQGDVRNQLSLEYSDPLDDQSTLEAGYSGELNSNDMDFRGEYFDTTRQAFLINVATTNHFIFNESIHALYATYKHSFGNFGFLGGLRTEQSSRSSNLVTLDSTIVYTHFSLYPTLHLSYKFSDAVELQLNYSRRIHRPESDDLNPFPEYRDPRNISAGNPSLLPEYIHSAEFGFKFENDAFSILPAIYYRHTDNRFTPVTRFINDSTLLTTRQNLSSDQSAGLEVIVSANAGDLFTAHANANAFYEQIDASNLGYGQNKSTVTWSGAITGTVSITRTTMLQLNSVFNSTRLTAQGEYRPSFVVNLGLRQELMGGKLSLIATAADLFRTLRRELLLDTPALVQTVVNTRDSRILYLGITYHFGAPPKKSKEDQLRYDDNL